MIKQKTSIYIEALESAATETQMRLTREIEQLTMQREELSLSSIDEDGRYSVVYEELDPKSLGEARALLQRL